MESLPTIYFDGCTLFTTNADPCRARFSGEKPVICVQAGLTALRWLSEGYGYEVTSADIVDAYTHTMSAAANADCVDEARERIQQLLANERPTGQLFKSVVSRWLSIKMPG